MAEKSEQEKQFYLLDQKINSFREEIYQNIKGDIDFMYSSISNIDSRLENVDSRLGKIGDEMKKIDSRLEKIDDEMKKIGGKIIKLEAQNSDMKTQISTINQSFNFVVNECNELYEKNLTQLEKDAGRILGENVSIKTLEDIANVDQKLLERLQYL